MKQIVINPCRLFSKPAAFGRLCVETSVWTQNMTMVFQPPSGGCVLKLRLPESVRGSGGPAAFGRLCVETKRRAYPRWYGVPAAFGRLCVETWCMVGGNSFRCLQPPSGGCVLKPQGFDSGRNHMKPAAFGRLCVETSSSEMFRCASPPAAFGRLCVETSFLADGMVWV